MNDEHNRFTAVFIMGVIVGAFFGGVLIATFSHNARADALQELCVSVGGDTVVTRQGKLQCVKSLTLTGPEK